MGTGLTITSTSGCQPVGQQHLAGMSARQLSAAPGWVALRLVPHQRLSGHLGVLGQRPHRRVPGAGLEHHYRRAVLGVVGERRVPQLVQRRPAGRGALNSAFL